MVSFLVFWNHTLVSHVVCRKPGSRCHQVNDAVLVFQAMGAVIMAWKLKEHKMLYVTCLWVSVLWQFNRVSVCIALQPLKRILQFEFHWLFISPKELLLWSCHKVLPISLKSWLEHCTMTISKSVRLKNAMKAKALQRRNLSSIAWYPFIRF
jgi:hypothetical protein